MNRRTFLKSLLVAPAIPAVAKLAAAPVLPAPDPKPEHANAEAPSVRPRNFGVLVPVNDGEGGITWDIPRFS